MNLPLTNAKLKSLGFDWPRYSTKAYFTYNEPQPGGGYTPQEVYLITGSTHTSSKTVLVTGTYVRGYVIDSVEPLKKFNHLVSVIMFPTGTK